MIWQAIGVLVLMVVAFGAEFMFGLSAERR